MSGEAGIVGIRISLEGAAGVKQGLDATSAATIKLEKATAAVSAAQARVEQTTLSATRAQAALAAAQADAGASAERLAAAQAKLSAAQAAQATATANLKAQSAALKDLQDAHAKAAAGAKLNAHQTAQLSAQLQDLFVQIQAGGNPLTAMIQQGSQLSAVFGGVGPALKAIGGLITPTTVALGALGGAAALVGAAFISGIRESDKLRGSLALTGNAAGMTADRYEAMAGRIAASTSTGIGAAKEALQALAESGRVSERAIGSTAAAAVALARATGQSSGEVAAKFAAMSGGVASGARALNEQYNFLTAAQYRDIKALEDHGDAMGALDVTMRALESRATTTVAQLGYLERAWNSTKTAASGAWDTMKGIGRDESVGEALAKAQANAQGYREGLYFRERTQGAQDYANAVKQAAGYEALNAHYASEAAEKNKAGIAWVELENGALSEQEKIRKQIAEIVAKGQAAGKTDAEIARVAGEAWDTSKAKALGLAEALARVQAAAAIGAAKNAAAMSALRGQLEAGAVTSIEYLEREGKLRAEAIRGDLQAIEGAAAVARAKKDNEAEVIALAGQAAAKRIELRAAERDALAAIDREIAKNQRDAYLAQVDADRRTNDEIDRIMQARAQRVAAAISAVDLYVQSIADAAEQTALEGRMLAATDAEREVAIRLLQVEIERRRELKKLAEAQGLTKEERDQQESRINAAAARAGADAQTKVYQAAWARTFDSVQDGLTAALLAGGRDGWDGVKRLVVSEVLTPVIKAQLAPLSAMITDAIMVATGRAPSGGGSGFSFMGGAGPDNVGIEVAGVDITMKTAGQALGYLDAFMSARSGKWGAAIGQAVGTYFGGPLGSVIGKTLGSIVDRVFSGGAGTPHVGGYASVDATGRITDTTAANGGKQDAQMQSAVGDFAQVLAASLNATAKAFGKEAAYSIQAAFEADSKDKSWGYLRVMSAGGYAGGFDARGTLAADPSKGFAEFAGMAAKSAADALMALDLPAWADKMLSAITESDGADKLDAVVQEIVSTQQAVVAFGSAFKGMGGVLGSIAGLSSDATVELANAAGGMSALSSGVSSYMQGFLSDGERQAAMLGAIGQQLHAVGVETPKTREAFKDLVNAQDLTTDGGRKTFAALMGVASAFAEVVPAGEKAARSAEDIASERASLEQRLLQAQGDTVALRNAERDALDATNRALYDQIVALEDAQAVASERAGLEQKLLTLQGNTTELRRREREALDPANRALYDQITALEDQADAADKAAKALDDAKDALADLIDGLKEAAQSALAGVQRAVDAQRKALQAAYQADVAKVDGALKAAKDTYAAEMKAIDLARKAAKAEFDAVEAEVRAAQDALEASAKAQAKQYEAATKALAAERAAVEKTYKAESAENDARIKAQKDSVDRLKALNTSLTSTLRALRPIDSEGADRARAQAQIRDALAVARSTGVLPTADDLKDALAIVAKPSEDLFGSFEDYLRDFYRTSLDIRDLADLSGTALDDAQTQLDAAIAIKDTLDANHAAAIERMDAQKEALDLANELAKEALALERDRLAGKLDSARSSYDSTLAGLDARSASAKDALDTAQQLADDAKQALKDSLDASLARLDSLIAWAEKQYNAALGIDDSVKTIPEAIQALQDALGALAPVTGGTAPAGAVKVNQWNKSGNVQTYTDPLGATAVMAVGQDTSQAIINGAGGQVTTVAQAQQFIDGAIAAGNVSGVAQAAAEYGISANNVDALAGYTAGTFAALSSGSGTIAGYSLEDIRAFVNWALSIDDAMSIYNKAKEVGLNAKSLDAIMGWPLGTSNSWAAAHNLPAFAAGGTFGGGLALVGEQGPELISTGPARIWNNADTMSMLRDPQRRDEALISEIQRLRQEVADLRADNNAGNNAIASSTSKSARLADRWDTDGLPATRTTT